MIRMNKITHATYESPDLDKQTEYYTEILGLTLVSKGKASCTSPPPSIITRWCCAAEGARNA